MGFFSSIFGHNEPSEDNKFETLRDDGVRAMQMGELPYAEKCLRAALSIRHDLKTVGFLAEVCLRKQDYQNALPLLEELKSKSDNTLDIEILLAQAQGQLKLFAEERDTTATILEKHSDEPRAIYLAAEAAHGLGEDNAAIDYLTGCLKIQPNYTQALLLRARIFLAIKEWDNALADAQALLQQHADNEEYLMLQAKSLIALERKEEAQANLEQVRLLNPFNDEAVLLLGTIYEQSALWNKALALYDEAIELSPNFAAAYKARSAVKQHLNDIQGAEADKIRADELSPDQSSQAEGEYTNVENEMNARYRNMNPYGF